MYTPLPPTSLNTGSGRCRQRKYKQTKVLTRKTKLSIKVKNALYHMENLNTLVQFAQIIGTIIIII